MARATRLRGFQDLLGPQAELFTLVEDTARRIALRYAVREIRVPLLEPLELYQRSTGETSDIVEKQMYTIWRDDAGTIGVRPEGTPGVVRAYIDAGLDRSDPEQRFYYSGPMFRHERPQKGRYRQFYQFGVEVFGRTDPASDAELVVMIDDLRRELNLELSFELNSLGCNDCRPKYRELLTAYARAHAAELCGDCKARLERNPLRLLDCKIDVKFADSAPKPLDHLCENCRRHFDTVMRLISNAGVAAKVNPKIVRGLDYYVRTAFEVTSSALGSQNAVGGGGRYDGLVELLGGAPVAGVGFALGLDRLALALEATHRDVAIQTDVALIALGEAAVERAMAVAHELRTGGRKVDLLSSERTLKAQMKRADKLGARYAIILGDDELSRGVAQLRNLAEGKQEEVPLHSLAAKLS